MLTENLSGSPGESDGIDAGRREGGGCDACCRDIGKDDVQYEAEFSTRERLPQRVVVPHLECYTAWIEASRSVAAVPDAQPVEAVMAAHENRPTR